MLRYIETFFEVVNRMSMAEAARRLKLTPAAVSKHVQALERELGMLLLKRSTRKLELTREGELYYEHAKKILEACRDAENALSNSKEEPSGKLKVVCGSQAVDRLLLPNLKIFLDRYPKVELEVALMQIIPDLEKEKVDVVVGFTKGFPPHWVQRQLLKARWVLCASPDYVEKRGLPKKSSDLQKHCLITHASRVPNNAITFANNETIFCDRIVCFNDTRAMQKAAHEGMGLVLLHDYIVESDLKSGKLVEILPDKMEKQKTISLYIAYLQTNLIPLKVRKFVDFVVETLATKS